MSEDVLSKGGSYSAIMLFEHFFARVGNQASLLVVIEGIDKSRTRVKSVSCGTSKGMLVKFDWGAAGSFAEEPIRHLRGKFQVTEY